MIVYSRNPAHDPPRRVEDHVYVRWQDFLASLEVNVRQCGDAALLELQPGDGTRYLFSLARDGERVVLACVTGAMLAVELSASQRLAPHDLPTPGGRARINPYTAAIACDLFNAAMGHDVERYYDWDAAMPRVKR